MGLPDVPLILSSRPSPKGAILAALYSELLIFMAVQSVGPVDFRITASHHAQSLALVLLGLTGPLVGLGLLRLHSRRP